MNVKCHLKSTLYKCVKTYILKGHSLCVHLCTPARKFELHNVKLRLKAKTKKH